VAGRVERLAAQRARRPAGRDHAPGPVDELPGGLGGQSHPQPVQVVVGLVLVVVIVRVVLGAEVDLGVPLAGLDRLDHHRGAVDVEGQAERADPELLVDRGVQRLVVVHREHRRVRQLHAEPPAGLGEQFLELLREQRHLDLLQRDADHPAAAAGLEEERPVPRLAHRAGDEPLRRLEGMYLVGHEKTLSGRTPGRPSHRPGSPRAQPDITVGH
jgi:hypothetical protein